MLVLHVGGENVFCFCWKVCGYGFDAVEGFIIHELSRFSVVQPMGFDRNHAGIDFAVVFWTMFQDGGRQLNFSV